MIEVTESMIPMIIVPLSFLFVLLIILVKKAPKAGLWVVGGLIVLAPIVFLRFARAGAFAHEEGIPLFVVPASFLFVLLIILLAKAPKAGAALVVALVLMAIVGLFVTFTAWDMRVAHVEESPVVPVVVESTGTAPIWSEGVEAAFEADVYPSRQSAIRAVGASLEGWIRQRLADANEPMEIVLFQKENGRPLMWDLERALEKAVPEIRCSIEAGSRNITGHEIGIELRLVDTRVEPVPWANTAGPQLASGGVEASARNRDRDTTASQSFIEKPWVADFASFVNERRDRQFVVARSQSACTGENEAKRQAEESACAQVLQRLEPLPVRLPGRSEPSFSATDLFEGGFIVDSFVQSFDGTAGRIWRQALLLDVSAPKLRRLEARMTRAARDMRMSWARMGLSAIGVLVVIGTVYFFLNMATRGYYEWSLRVAGVVLAIVAVISVLMIIR